MNKKNKIEKKIILFICIFIFGSIIVHSTPKMAVRWCVFKSGDISCALNAEIAEADQYNHDLTTYYWVRDSSVRYKFPFVVKQFTFLYFCSGVDHTPPIIDS